MKQFTDTSEKSFQKYIDMYSYRPSKVSTQNLWLMEEPGEVDPIPVDVKGRKQEPELDTLKNILDAFNKRFGDIERTDKDKVRKILTEQLPAEMKADKEMMDTVRYSDKQNAKITSDKKLVESLSKLNKESAAGEDENMKALI